MSLELPYMFTIPFTPFPSDIYVDELGHTVGCTQHAKSVFGDGVNYMRIAKQKTVTGDNRCLEYYWSYWAKLIDIVDGIRHYSLDNTDLAPAGKFAAPAE
jgi:hypothetical protein